MKRLFRFSTKRFLIGASLVAILLMVGVSSAAADDWYVSNAGNDGNDCMSPLTACQTIQAAINKASSNDTIHVTAGVYPEITDPPSPLTINKTLTLLGAQAGMDARSPRVGESIVTDSQGTYVAADNVVIDGFTIQDSTNNAYTGYGIWMGCRSGTRIVNNIVQNNIIGIGLSNPPGGAQALVRHNQIQNNNNEGSSSGTGIYTDQYVSCGAVKNVLIEENNFIGNDNAGIDISNTDPARAVYDLEVADNSFDGNGRGLVLFNTHDSTIHDNRITTSTLAQSAAIRIFDNNIDLSIMNNDLTNGAGRGIRISDIDAVDPGRPNPSSRVVINYNNIGIAGSGNFVDEGLRVEADGHQGGTVNAECNWWGASSGPTNPSNPSGTGEEVVGDADFTPWLTAPAPEGPCTGLPNTPGKVTGGGQILGDPVFSSLGALLSAPAVVPSLADPKAQATFGFTVKCCEPSGNLEYDDHQAGVRIKAKSIDGLNISDSICGPNTHATFTGTASVIRSTGTTSESFTVDVDDCGEPGTMDKFGIKTMSYSNPPSGESPLIGGNIQIHK